MGRVEEVPWRRRGAGVLYWGAQQPVLDANAVPVGLRLSQDVEHNTALDP